MIDPFKLKAPGTMRDMIKLASTAARDRAERPSFAPLPPPQHRQPTDAMLIAAVLAGALIQTRTISDAPITQVSEAVAVWREVLAELQPA